MNLKNTIVTGKHLRELGETFEITQLDLQALMGLYAATLVKLTAEQNADKPVDRIYGAMVRFLAHNYPQFYKRVSHYDNLHISTLEELQEAHERNPIEVGGQELDLTSNAHLGIVIFRGYGAARNFLHGNTTLTLPVVKWVNHVINCCNTGQKHLIERVIQEEAEAHDLDIDKLLREAWPKIVS